MNHGERRKQARDTLAALRAEIDRLNIELESALQTFTIRDQYHQIQITGASLDHLSMPRRDEFVEHMEFEFTGREVAISNVISERRAETTPLKMRARLGLRRRIGR